MDLSSSSFADVAVGLRLRHAELLDIRQPRRDHVLVDVANGRDLHVGKLPICLEVIEAASAQADHGDANAVVRAQDVLTAAGTPPRPRRPSENLSGRYRLT